MSPLRDSLLLSVCNCSGPEKASYPKVVMKFTEIQTFILDRDRRIGLSVPRCSLSLTRATCNYGSFPSLLRSISIRVLQFASDESLRDAPRKIPVGCDRTESSPSELLILHSRAGVNDPAIWEPGRSRLPAAWFEKRIREIQWIISVSIDRTCSSFFFRDQEIHNPASPLKYLLDQE